MLKKSGALCAPRGTVSYGFISFRAVSINHAAYLLRAIAEKDEGWRKKADSRLYHPNSEREKKLKTVQNPLKCLSKRSTATSMGFT
jgi:hypothetical protein